jgi:AcrR family transcriptional regulator
VRTTAVSGRQALFSGPGEPPPPSEQLSPRLRRTLEELGGLFLREGFLHLSTEDIARRLQCSKRTLYQLASSRDEIFDLVIERWLAGMRSAGIAAAEGSPDPVTALRQYLDVAVVATRNASSQFVRDLARFPAGHRRLMSHQRERAAGLERLIDRGVKAGAFRGVHPKLVADVLLAAASRMVDPDVLLAIGLSMSQAFEELYNIFEYGLIPRDRSRGERGRRARAQG